MERLGLRKLFEAPIHDIARPTLGDLALLCIESWSQAVAFLELEEPTVFWMNSTAERCLREHGATLSGRRIQLAQRERQRDFEEFLSITATDRKTWVLNVVGDVDALVFRCGPIGQSRFRVLTIFHTDNPPTVLPDVGAIFGLTPSESRTLDGLVSGQRADELARASSVSIETVRTHIRRIYNKLGVNSREQMIAKINAYRVPE